MDDGDVLIESVMNGSRMTMCRATHIPTGRCVEHRASIEPGQYEINKAELLRQLEQLIST